MSTAVCSHRRAYYYYAEALKESQRFPAYPCSSMDEYRNGRCPKVAGAHLGDDPDHCSDDGGWWVGAHGKPQGF